MTRNVKAGSENETRFLVSREEEEMISQHEKGRKRN